MDDLPDIRKLQIQIRYAFLDPALLGAALTHASHSEGASRGGRNDDGQFAFLGDAVLGLVLADRDIAGGKGALTKQRADKANNDYLQKLAQDLALPLRVGKGEKNNEAGKRKRLSSGLDAVIGAIYLDAGPAHAIKVVNRLLNNGPERVTSQRV